MQTKILKNFLWLYLLVMFFISAYIYGIVLKANGDNVEHLHTSWMVWMGYIPYKDFFQHHNPLTWYISAPIVAAFINSFNVFSIFNIIGVGMLYIIAYYHSKIFLLNQSNRIGALFLAGIIASAFSLLWSTDYRPDTFMFVFFYMGLYYLLRYSKTGEQKSLIISFTAFFISFLFTQKVFMHLVIPGTALLYWLCTGRVKFKHLLYASIPPLIMLLLFIFWLYHNDALEIYWKSNYPFNLYIPKIFEEQRIIFPPKDYIDFYIFIPIALIASCCFLYQGDEIQRLFSVMFLFETVLRMFYFSAFLHYVIFWLMTAIMLSVMWLSDFYKRRQYITLVGFLIILPVSRYLAHVYGYEWSAFNYEIFLIFICSVVVIIFVKREIVLTILGVTYLLFMSWYNYKMTYKVEIETHKHLNGHEVAFNNLTPCDYAINGYYATYNLKAKDPGYYSILLGQIDVLGEKAGIAKRDNLNDLIRQYKPKLVSAGVFWDTYWEQRGKKIPAHTIDSTLINTYYQPTGVGDIFILKPQYQRHNCVYNGKEWKFMD